MKRSFPLAGLLRVRSVQERAAAAHLSRAALDRAHTDARDRQLRTALTASADSPGDVRSLAALAAGRVAARSMLSDLRVLRDAQTLAVDEARAAHRTARTAEQGLERLADAHARREIERRQHAEQLDLDEIALRPRTEETP